MFGLGPLEIAVIAAIVMMLFGPSVIRRFFHGLTETVKETRKIRAAIEEPIQPELPKGGGR